MNLDLESVIFVAGHRGMVGRAIVEELNSKGFTNILTRTHRELDLTRQAEVEEFFRAHKVDCVVICAAKVGGIHANNSQPAQFIYENLMMECNLIHSAWRTGVQKILFLGSSCIYPRNALQPIKEEYLLSGKLEPTNEPYAIAKIAGIKLCESYNRQYKTDYRSVMPTNIYGPFDNFDLQTSHVLPALIRKFHEAKVSESKSVTLWGTGSPKRDFLHVNDLAKASVHVLLLPLDALDPIIAPMESHINIGSGFDLTIKELAETISEVVGFKGEIIWDQTMPDGTPRKFLDTSIMQSLGWRPSINLTDGIRDAYQWFLKNRTNKI